MICPVWEEEDEFILSVHHSEKSVSPRIDSLWSMMDSKFSQVKSVVDKDPEFVKKLLNRAIEDERRARML